MIPPPEDSASTLGNDRRSGTEWICLAVAGLVLVGFRLHAFDLPLETDECNYAYIAGRLLAGDALYVDVWDHQPFGVFALFAGFIALSGDAPEVFRWTAVLFSLASLALVHAIVRRCAGPAAALTAAVLFAMASSDPGTAGEGCNREIYMNTCILAAWYLALRPAARPGASAFASGLALGVGSTLKTILAVHWVFLGVFVALAAWRRGRCEKGFSHQRSSRTGESGAGEVRVGILAPARSGLRSTVVTLAMFAAGPVIIWVSASAYFALTDRFDEFVDAVFLFNLGYSDRPEGFLVRFLTFFRPEKHPFTFDSAWPIWVGGAISVAWLIFKSAARRRPDTLVIVLLATASYVGVCLPGRFWPHYYYLLVPALVIAVSIALADLGRKVGGAAKTPTRWAGVLRLAALYSVVPLMLAGSEYRGYLAQPPFGITVTRYNSRDFWGRAHGVNIGRITEPEDRIFVYGNEAEIYYYSRRRCASRYTMITGLKSGYPNAERRRATLMAELRRNMPRLIIVVFDEQPFEEWKEFLAEYYGEPIGWDFNDRTGEPIMFALAREDRPVEPINWDWDRKQVGGWNLGEDR